MHAHLCAAPELATFASWLNTSSGGSFVIGLPFGIAKSSTLNSLSLQNQESRGAPQCQVFIHMERGDGIGTNPPWEVEPRTGGSFSITYALWHLSASTQHEGQ